MTYRIVEARTWGVGVVLSVLLLASSAQALDAYQDRTGGFAGFGVGGGLVLEGSEAGGGGFLDFQFGAGATRNLTVGLDVDAWVHGMADNLKLVITPGPEVTYFFGKTGFFIRPGVAFALAMIWPDEADFDVQAGVDLSLGAGWEFFVNANTAMGMALEGGYTIMPNMDNLVAVAMVFTVRGY